MTVAFRQVVIPEDQVRQGLPKLPYWEVPATLPFAITKLEPLDLEDRLGIKFQASFDDLDFLSLAVLALPSGYRFSLIRHWGGAPGTGIYTLERDIDSAEMRKTVLD